MGVFLKCVFSLNGMMILLIDLDYWVCIGVKDRVIIGRLVIDCYFDRRVKWVVVFRCEINRYILLLDILIIYC